MINFDHVLEKIGGIGLAQFIILIFVGYSNVIGGYTALATVFIAYQSDFRCNVPPLDNSTAYPSLTEDNILNLTTPYNQGSESYDTCRRYGYDLTTCVPDSISCVNRSASEIYCDDGYHYDRSIFSETIITDYDLVCDRAYLIPLTTSLYYVGIIAGSLVFGNLSDRFGRKPTLVLSSLCAVGSLIGVAYSSSVEMFTIFRTLCAAFTFGSNICSFVYIMESTGTKWRTLLSMMYQMLFSFGFMILGGLSYNWRNWHELELVVAIFTAPLFLIALIMPESPRWLFTTGKEEKGIKVVTRLGKINGVTLTEEDWREARKHTEKNSESEVTENTRKHTQLDLYKTPGIRITTFKVMFSWCANSFVYYGISLNAGALAGDVFVNNTLNGVFEIASFIFCILVMDRIGRRLLISALLFIAGGGLLASVIVNEYAGEDDGLITLGLVFAFVSKFGIAGSFGIIYLYTSELYPTVVRSNGVGNGSLAARIGGISAPYVIELQNTIAWLPGVIFGVVAVSAGFVSLSFPETNGAATMETIEQAEVFYKTGIVVDINELNDKTLSLDARSSGTKGQHNIAYQEDGITTKI